MFTKGSLIRGWFIGTTVFTCFTFSDYLSANYFHDSKIPWLIGVFTALAINWSAIGSLKQLR
ncbi:MULTISPECIES: hypothetical protein [Enterobacteriaceae]|uniref:hypothetical protein n=1 Tax=Enterobacteriaceae TaxID=543 RepID=UPI00034ED29C|nr:MULTISPECIES: hypothetical protein [Enterobacteriaceae]AGN84031.1 hypothetical protein H650_02180 [Enterobacter sp. R4-368]MCZ3381894.1 hypothetical protein [Kosakonia sp. SOY2]